MRVLVDVLVILSVPAFVMEIQQILTIPGSYYELYCCPAPNVLSVVNVQFFAGFDRVNLVARDPVLVLFRSLLPALKLFGLPLILFCEYDHLDGIVDHERELKNLSSDILAALRALFSPHEALRDALVAE
jgi:hypothetical protein